MNAVGRSLWCSVELWVMASGSISNYISITHSPLSIGLPPPSPGSQGSCAYLFFLQFEELLLLALTRFEYLVVFLCLVNHQDLMWFITFSDKSS